MRKNSTLLVIFAFLLVILLVIFAFLLVSLFAFTGCSITVPSSEPDGPVPVVVGGQEKLDEIIAANEHLAVLESHSDILMTYIADTEEGDVVVDYYLRKIPATEEGGSDSYIFDFKMANPDGSTAFVTNVRQRESFSCSGDGKEVYTLYPEKDDNAYALYSMPNMFDDKVLDGSVFLVQDETESYLTFNLIEKDAKYKGVINYAFTASVATNLLTSMVYTYTEVDGTISSTYTMLYDYDVTDYVVDESAYESIKLHDGNKLTFEVEYAYEGVEEPEIFTFSVKEGVKIFLAETTDGRTYDFYENKAYTRDIADVAEYVTYYGEFATVFVAPTQAHFSFDVTMTEADITEMQTFIAEYVAKAGEDDIEGAELIRANIEEKMLYFVHQYHVAQIAYYSNIYKSSTKELYNFVVQGYNDMYVAYLDMYKQVYELNNTYSGLLFESWSEEDIEMLYRENEEISTLEVANQQLEQEYNALSIEDENWSAQVEEIYQEFVANNQRLAELNGYDNAYEYMATENYKRSYTVEEREALKTYIRNYMVGFHNEANLMFSDAQKGLTQSLYDKYASVALTNATVYSNRYIKGYVETYSGTNVGEKMKGMFEKGVISAPTSGGAMQTAYVNYSSYYDQGFAFFGRDCQDLMTVTHEMGHYVSTYTYPFGSWGYDFAETHSQSNEWLMMYYLKDIVGADVFNLMYHLQLVNATGAVIRGMLVDEFEYRVYTAETPYVAGEYRGVMEDVLEDLGVPAVRLNDYYDGYVQLVTINSPVYYLNYVTSSIVSMEFYAIAESQGYEEAQELYCKLLEDCNVYDSYHNIIKSIGLGTPFEEDTYLLIQEVFFPDED